MADEEALERITILLQARDRDFQRAMDRSNKLVARFARQADRETAQMSRRVDTHLARAGESALAFGRNFGRGLAAGAVTAVFGGITVNLRSMVRDMAAVSDGARQAGVGLRAFQEWRFVAEQNRIGIDMMTDGFRELNLRADEFIVTGAGAGAEAFQRLGFSAEDLAGQLEDPSALMLELMERMRGLDTAARIRIADEIFGGTAGERFVQLVDQGAAGLRQTIDRAHDLGAVLEDDVVTQAIELDRRFTEVTTRISTMFRTAVVDVARLVGLIRETQELMAYDPETAGRVISEGVNEGLAELGEVSAETRAEIEGLFIEMAYLAGEGGDVSRALDDAAMAMRGLGRTEAAATFTDLAQRMRTAASGFEDGEITAEDFRVSLEDVAREAGAVVEGLGEVDRARVANVSNSVSGLLELIGQIPGRVAEAEEAIRTFDNLQAVGTVVRPFPVQTPGSGTVRPRRAPALLGEPDPDTGTDGAGGGARDAYAGAAEQMREQIRLLELEATALVAAAAGGQDYADAIDFARHRAELMNAALRDGREITPALQAEIDQLAEAYITAGQSAEEAADRLERMREASERGASAITDVFMAMTRGGDAARQAIGRLLLQMAEVQMMRGVRGLMGGGGGIFAGLGRLLGYSAGGYTGPGAAQEPRGIVHAGEYVFSKPAVDRIGIGALEAMHRGVPGFARGGRVGDARAPKEGVRAVRIEVHNHVPADIDARHEAGPSGEEVLRVELGRQVARGSVDQQLGGRYGLRPQATRR